MGGGGNGESPNLLQVLFEGAIAGGAAGVVVETALYPIDTIKTRLQVPEETIASAYFIGVMNRLKEKLLEMFPENLSAIAHLAAGGYWRGCFIYYSGSNGGGETRMQMSQFKTAPDAVRLIVAKEGIKGLYAAKRDLKDAENAIIGAFAGAITGALTTPLDVMKTRLMIQGPGNQYRGFIDCAQTILRDEGAGAFLKGIEPRVLWIGIGGSIFFGVLEKTKSILADRTNRRDAKLKLLKGQFCFLRIRKISLEIVPLACLVEF
ncbi:hypothetical protein EJB05_29911 [Eragrostis curvula]|uniref:Uncharacterized protein n=1 Tax=Eragrostis curvula TaxID=38414 RepID=A0A5J9UTW4_9POAL|nr:hypothetical protein EJB05_29911 [Eragrostis curvula]